MLLSFYHDSQLIIGARVLNKYLSLLEQDTWNIQHIRRISSLNCNKGYFGVYHKQNKIARTMSLVFVLCY